jgi:hypothetical protein
VGFAQPPRRRDAGALLPHRFTLAGPPFTWDGGREGPLARALGGFVSVALSRGFPRVDSSTTLPFGVRTFLENPLSGGAPRLLDLQSQGSAWEKAVLGEKAVKSGGVVRTAEQGARSGERSKERERSVGVKGAGGGAG